MKVTPMCHFQTDIGAAGTNVPIREKAHSGVSPAGAAKNAAQGIRLKAALIRRFQTAASVLSHRLPHSAKPHPQILPQRGICLKALLMQVFQTAASERPLCGLSGCRIRQNRIRGFCLSEV